MSFQTKIVESSKNPNAKIAWAGGGLIALAMILMSQGDYLEIGVLLFGIGVILLVIGAVAAKGDVAALQVSDTDISISADGIRVGDDVYSLKLVSDLEFHVEGYNGMANPYSYNRSSQRCVDGMNNRVCFHLLNEEVEWRFYLADPQQVQQLGALFKDLYAKGIPFLEAGPGGDRTFLFEPVSQQEWEDRMTVNGYRYKPTS